jgi:hypothetical protein
MKAAKLESVLQLRVAMPRNSLSLQKRFSIFPGRRNKPDQLTQGIGFKDTGKQHRLLQEAS